jgi:hypothetical protein
VCIINGSACVINLTRPVTVCIVNGHTRREEDGVNSERKNITQPVDWWAMFQRAARRAGMTLSEWMGECAKANLRRVEAKNLSLRPQVGAPPKPKPK